MVINSHHFTGHEFITLQIQTNMKNLNKIETISKIKNDESKIVNGTITEMNNTEVNYSYTQ